MFRIMPKRLHRIVNLCFFLFSLLTFVSLKAQEVGVSASFFIPKYGYFSTPISPLAIRGIGFEIVNRISIESGITLYRMSGLNIKDLPFESKKPLIGPTFTIMVPLEMVLELGSGRQLIRFKGGGFSFYSFDQKINDGNLDRALVTFSGFDLVNSNFEVENKIGAGIHFGAEYIYYITDAIGITLGGYYYIGGAKVNLQGSYDAGSQQLGFSTFSASFQDSKVDFTGIEISLGLLFNSG